MSGNGPAVGLTTPLRRREFRLLWLAQTISDLGDGLTSLALMLLALKLAGSAMGVAGVLIALEIPQVTIGLMAGVVVDRRDRRSIMLASDAVRAVLVLAFVVVDAAQALPALFAVAFLQASVGTFFSPARTALVASSLPAEELFAANSLSQLSRVLATVLGASAAGILIGASGEYWPAFAFDAATFLVSVALVSRVAVRPESAPAEAIPVEEGEPAGGMLGELREGLGVVVRTPVLLGTMIATATALLGIGAVNVLWVPLFQNDLHVPTALFGTADLAQAAALILSATFAARFLARFGATSIISGTLAVLGLAVALVSVATAFWHVLALLFAMGICVSPLQAAVTTISQTSVRDEVRGRAAAAMNAVTSSANITSMGLAGVVAGVVGVRPSFVLAGGIIVGSAAVASFLFRRAGTSSVQQLEPDVAGKPASP